MIPLARPEIGDEEIAAVVGVLRSRNLVQGKFVSDFESTVAKYLGVSNVIAVSSGTAAIHIALLSLGIGPGDEVIVPDFTFPATANAVELCGATPVFCDIDIDTLNMDVSRLPELVTSRTKVIMPVHEFGCPADMDPIMQLAKRRGIHVIEDAACALGAEYKSKRVGTIGTIGCFSLHPRKAITTGEGGLVTCNDDKIAYKLKLLRNHGIENRDGRIDFVCAGLNYRLTELQAAMGIVQFGKLEQLNARRRQIASDYSEKLKNGPLRLPKESENGIHVFQTYHVVLPKTVSRDSVILHLKEKGIGSNYGANALHLLTHHQRFANNRAYPVAETAHKFGLALPTYASMADHDIDRVAQELLKLVSI